MGAMQDSFPHSLELSKKGYNAFVLIYRPGAQTACEDLARAIAFLRKHEEELQVDMSGYSLWGGSAGARMAAWGGIVGMDEIIIDLSQHKTTENIMVNRAFTVSPADVEHMTACDYAGIVSAGKEPKKMEKAGFTTSKSNFVNAPVINELPVTLECELAEVIGGSKYLGKIKNVSVDESVLGGDGEISLEKFHPITYDTIHYGYYGLSGRVGNAFKDGASLK